MATYWLLDYSWMATRNGGVIAHGGASHPWGVEDFASGRGREGKEEEDGRKGGCLHPVRESSVSDWFLTITRERAERESSLTLWHQERSREVSEAFTSSARARL